MQISTKIKAVIFDMAGTTVDEQNIVYKTVQRAIQVAGHKVDLDTVLRFAAGKEKLDAIKAVLTFIQADIHPAESIFTDFKTRLKTAYETELILPQPGAEAVFQALKDQNIKVVLNTGYDRTTVQQLLKKLKWEDHPLIDLVVCASDVQRGRPHPDMIELAMTKLGITDPKTVVKIGDSAVDIEEGIQAGCLYNIGITTGAQAAEQLQVAKPSHIIDNLEDLLEIC